MSNMSQDIQQHFYNIPATIRRHAFLQGRLSLPGLFSPRPARQRDPVEQKPKADGVASHGGSRDSKQRRKLAASASVNRLSRKQRNRLLASKCRAAGVRNAAGLALAN